jgi:hypothetical protein
VALLGIATVFDPLPSHCPGEPWAAQTFSFGVLKATPFSHQGRLDNAGMAIWAGCYTP